MDMKKEFMHAEEEFTDASIMGVRVETTGLCGGDTGHGGETSVLLRDCSSTDWDIAVGDRDGDLDYVCITVRGDSEARNLGLSMLFAGRQILHLCGIDPDTHESATEIYESTRKVK